MMHLGPVLKIVPMVFMLILILENVSVYVLSGPLRVLTLILVPVPVLLANSLILLQVTVLQLAL